ncbi:sensor histidine kinase [Agromyces seonyuensis]|uniref:histidine kinase n=1 Tax=Agromyces seonyuensis TaxID=2662446 RepID=A0A6I4P5F2_9MICO|nr:sensor histidine kinase [Agromyces seonyuensis]MWB98757.1 sensor histidine kinase [Agromyces seonyuensis]
MHESAAWDGPRFRPPARAVLLAPVVLSFLAQVPWTIASCLRADVGGPVAALAIGLAVAGPLLLLAARRLPGPTVAAVAAIALGLLLSAPGGGPAPVAFGFALGLAAARGALAWALGSGAVAWLGALLLGPLVGLDWHPARVAATTAALAACVAAGAFVRNRSERARGYRDAVARRRESAAERERLRIAGELHDVLGHSLSLINVRAGVALHLLDRDPEQARSALADIKRVSKDSLDEVRGVLGVLREPGESAPSAPQPGLAELDALVADVRAAGLEVELDPLDGEGPPRAVQTAAYRIVQEALTNVLRHSGAEAVRIGLRREGGELVVRVEDDGRGAAGAHEGGGVLGMRGRAEVLGGRLDVAEPATGGTSLTARLPWEGVA